MNKTLFGFIIILLFFNIEYIIDNFKNKNKRKMRWKKMKKKGLIPYILIWGVLYYGLIGSLILIIIIPWIEFNFSFNFIYNQTYISWCFISAIIVLPIGIISRYLKWKDYEKKYESL